MNKHKRRTTPEINSRRSGARVLRSCPGLLPQAAVHRLLSSSVAACLPPASASGADFSRPEFGQKPDIIDGKGAPVEVFQLTGRRGKDKAELVGA